MRRTAVAVTGFGVVMGVFAAGGLTPASASPANTHAAGRGLASSHVSRAGSSAIRTKSKPSGPTAPATSGTVASGMQTVTYDGDSVTVPASWQVFHLDSDPGQCVRYDINAVYLGSPGANQNCPSNLMGRDQTITITPAGVSKSGQVSAGGAAAQGGLVQSPPPSVAGRRIAAQTGTFSQLNEYGEANELRASVPGGGLSVTGTWGSDSTQVTGYVRGIHRVARTRSDRPISSGQTSGTSSGTSSWVAANQTDTQPASAPPPV